MGKRWGAAVSAILIISTSVVGVFAASASAKATKVKPSLSCDVTGTATISPGISTNPAIQTLTVTTSLVDCVNSSVEGITGTSEPNQTVTTGTKTEVCKQLGKKGKPIVTSDQVADWNYDNLTSTSTYKTTLNKLPGGPGTATIAGKVVSGTFAKGKITGLLTYTLTSTQCTPADPIQGATISGTFDIT